MTVLFYSYFGFGAGVIRDFKDNVDTIEIWSTLLIPKTTIADIVTLAYVDVGETG